MPPGAAAKPAGLELIATLKQGVKAAEGLLADARLAVAARVMRDGRPDPRALDREQRAAHGLAWLATYVEAIRQLAGYAERLMEGGGLGETEQLLIRIGAGEYLAQMFGGIPMSQGEIVRPADLGLTAAATAARMTGAVEALIASGNTAPHRARLAATDARQSAGDGRRLRPRRYARFDPRGDAQIRRRQGGAARASLAPQQ